MMDRLLAAIGLRRTCVRNVLTCQSSVEFARHAYPLGTYLYSHFPINGIFRVNDHKEFRCNDGISRTEIYGELVAPLAFGYPDESCRGDIIERVMNCRSTFVRGGREVDGAWVLSHKVEQVKKV